MVKNKNNLNKNSCERSPASRPNKAMIIIVESILIKLKQTRTIVPATTPCILFLSSIPKLASTLAHTKVSSSNPVQS